MSILIKGMEMPQSCDDCRLNNGVSCYAVPEYTEDSVVGRTDDRPDWCPLISIPPHGDLIDKDATMNAILEDRGEDTACWFAGIVNDMPAVIPSDKAEEGET